MRTLTRLAAIFLLMTPLCTQAQSGSLMVSFGQDTIYACINEPHELLVEVDGGISPYTYVWSTGDTDTSLVIVPVTGTSFFSVIVTDSAGAVGIDTIWVTGLPECVWPGDANGDGAANNLDLLSIGRAYGIPGMTRPNSHLNWIGQPAPSWTHTFNNGVNYAHADADGDGIVDAPDIQGILHNYDFPQALVGGSSTGPAGIPLYLDIPPGNNNSGDTIIASIMLGTSAFPADSIYGIAFSISYDSSLIDSGSARIDFSDSWLGDTAIDLKGIGRNFFGLSQLDIAMTRIDHTPRTGYGRIADIIITIDDIAGKTAGIKMLDIEIRQVWLIRLDGSLVEVSLFPSQVAVVLLNNEALPEAMQSLVQVHPNPASDQVTISIADANLAAGARMEWLDMAGRVMYQKSLSGVREEVFSVQMLPPGLYMVRIHTERGYVGHKVLIR